MGMDVVRHIEVYTPDICGYMDPHNFEKLGKLDVGDIVLVYEGTHNYMKIAEINKGKFVYEPIPEPTTMDEALSFSPVIAFRVCGDNNLPKNNVKLKKGDIYRTGVDAYKVYNGEGWDDLDKVHVPFSWKCVSNRRRDYVYEGYDENYEFGSGCSDFVMRYIYNEDEPLSFAKRGIPNDATKETVNDFNQGGYFRPTWLLLSDLEDVYNSEYEKFRTQCEDNLRSRQLVRIEKKIDTLLNDKLDVTNISEDDCCDWYESDFNEGMWNVMLPMLEKERIEAHLIHFAGYVRDDYVRVIYYFCN